MQQPTKCVLTDYELLETIGRGERSEVRLARHKGTKEYHALKMILKEESVKRQQEGHLHNEHTILYNCNHAFVVSMDGYAQDK